MSFLKKASLLTIPTAYKQGKLYSVKPDDGSGDFTFTRSTSATRVNEAGLIEKARENLLLASNNFSDATYWNNQGSLTSGQAGYDGTNNAWLFQNSTTGTGIYQSFTTSGVQTFSVYVKKDATYGIRFFTLGSATVDTFFNLNTGNVVYANANTIEAKIEAYNTDWWRISVTFDESLTRIYLYPTNNGTANAVGSYTIQDAQLEAGLVATDYIETTTSTVSTGIVENVPRIDYSSGTPSLLLEPQRTNLINYSDYFDATEWNNPNNTRDCIITKTNDINPAGEASAYSYEATGSSNQIAYLNSLSTGTTITNSIYVKRVTGTGNVILRDVNNALYNFSLTVADGWKRIDTTEVLNSSNVRFYLNLQTIGDKILIWGAQQEEGSYATSYIPTYGTSVTRTDEKTNILDLGITGQDVTHFVELDNNVELIRDSGAADIKWSEGGGAYLGSVRIFRAGSNLRRFDINLIDTNGTFPFSLISINTDNAKVAIKRIWATGEIKVFVNGVLELSATSTNYTTWNHLELQGVGDMINVKSLLSFPTALTDADCEILTGEAYSSFEAMANSLNYTIYE